MKKAIVVDANDMKKILAEYFNVAPECVIKSQYSYTIIIDDASRDGAAGLVGDLYDESALNPGFTDGTKRRID